MMSKCDNASSDNNRRQHHHRDVNDKEIGEEYPDNQTSTTKSKVHFALNETVVIHDEDNGGTAVYCYGDDHDVDINNHKNHIDVLVSDAIEKQQQENSGEITAASTITSNPSSIIMSRCQTTSSCWYTEEELQSMKDSDEFIITKQSYSRFARCRCCKGYKVCRGLELRCPTNISKRNNKIEKLRTTILEYHQNMATSSIKKDDEENGNTTTTGGDKLAQKYSELCSSDTKEAIDVGRLDALQAQLLMETSWRSRSNNFRDSHDEDDETYIQLFPSRRSKSNVYAIGDDNNDDGSRSVISELSFDYNLHNKKGEEGTTTSSRKKKGNGNDSILRRTGRSLLRALKLNRKKGATTTQ